MLMWSRATMMMTAASVVAIAAVAAVSYRIATTVPVPLVGRAPAGGVVASGQPSPATTSAPAPAAQAPAPPATLQTGAAPAAPAISLPATAPAAQVASAPVVPAPKSAAPAQASGVPTFDVVRVEPTGETVVAGRASPGTQIELLDGGRRVGSVKADVNGQFVMLPPKLGTGGHELTLVSKPGAGVSIASEQTVTVAVSPGKNDPVLVALAAPDKPTQVLSGGATGTAVGDPKAPVYVRSAEASGDGRFFASGTSAPGANLHLYLNGAEVAAVTADRQGNWSLTVTKGLAPGSYKVRADQVDASGAVVTRAEVPFDMTPSRVASAGADVVTGGGSSGADALIADLRTVRVSRGDSLWRISRTVLGQGNRYTQIYEANVKQIRDQRLIYPGQVFVVPKS